MISYGAGINRYKIPWQLLTLAKQHMRVTFADDDQIIVWKLTTAIDQIERQTGHFMFERTATWTPTLVTHDYPAAYNIPAGTIGLAIPVGPVASFIALDPSDVDVSSDFLIYGQDPIDPAARAYLTTTTALTTPKVTLTLGYPEASDIPPGLVDLVLKVAAYLYEFREQQNMPGMDGSSYSNTLISGFWRPRC